MYDIATKGVTHLNGELSLAFVKVAEENANTHNLDEMPIVDSGIVEQMETAEDSRQHIAADYSDYNGDRDEDLYRHGPSDSASVEDEDAQPEPSEHKPIYVYPINSKYRRVQINSGYSNIKN